MKYVCLHDGQMLCCIKEDLLYDTNIEATFARSKDLPIMSSNNGIGLTPISSSSTRTPKNNYLYILEAITYECKTASENKGIEQAGEFDQAPGLMAGPNSTPGHCTWSKNLPVERPGD